MPEKDRPPRLLAVSHEGSQTGAPIVLATLLEWLRAHTDVSIHTVLLQDGPLRTRFSEIGTVTAGSDPIGSSALELVERGLAARGSRRAVRYLSQLRHRAALSRVGQYDLVYLNSMTTLEVLPYLTGSPRVIAHMHEASVAFGSWRRADVLEQASISPTRWVAVSDETAQSIEALGVRPDRIAVHHPFIDVDAVRRNTRTRRQQAMLRRFLGIPSRAAIVVGSGTIEWRKGADLFVQLAGEVRRHPRYGDRPVHFVWVGGERAGVDWDRLQADVARSQCDHVHFTGHVADPRPYFQLADVFALTSREDPYPLVCLEHAALGTPIVAYSSSGIRDFLAAAGSEAAEGVIPYLDVGSMAATVYRLLQDPTRRALVSSQLTQHVIANHDVSVAAPRLAAELGLIGPWASN